MYKTIVGIIPEKISYIYGQPKDIFINYDYYSINTDIKKEVFPAYSFDPKDMNMLNRVHRIAKFDNRHYVNGGYVDYPLEIDELVNNSIKIQLLTIEYKNYCNKQIYKVLIDDKYYVDLANEVFDEAILRTPISSDGVLNGDFIWGKIDSKMTLVRMGSTLYKLLVESHNKKDLPKVSKRKFEVGGVYKYRNGTVGIFLGFVNTTFFGYNRGYYIADDLSLNSFPIIKGMLFYFLYSNSNDYEKELNKQDLYKFSIMRNHSFIEKISQLKLNKNYISIARNIALKEMKNIIISYSQSRFSKNVLFNEVCLFSGKINMYEYGGSSVELFNIKKYILFT